MELKRSGVPFGGTLLPLHRLHFSNCSLFIYWIIYIFFCSTTTNAPKQTTLKIVFYSKRRYYEVRWFRTHILCMYNYFTITFSLLLCLFVREMMKSINLGADSIDIFRPNAMELITIGFSCFDKCIADAAFEKIVTIYAVLFC